MKITIDNIQSNWKKIKDDLPPFLIDDYEDIVDDIPDYGKNDDIDDNINDFIERVNKYVGKAGKSKESDEDFVEDKKPAKKSEKKEEKEKKPKTNKAKDSAVNSAPKNKPATIQPPSTEAPAKDKTAKTKNDKKAKEAPEVDTSKALPHWHRLLKKYASWADTDKGLNYVHQYLLDIQGSCNSKLKHKTPFVATIQKIHDTLREKYNKAYKAGDDKIHIPGTYKNEVLECFKKAKVGRSKSIRMEEFEETTLSGHRRSSKKKKKKRH